MIDFHVVQENQQYAAVCVHVMGGLIQGAALGAAFGLLLSSVVYATHKVARFTSHLNTLKSTLSTIKPAIQDIESFNQILDRPIHETEAFTVRLMEGEKLIRKCSTVKWNVFLMFYYSNKLRKLEGSLVNLFQINVAARHFREGKKISVVVGDLEEKINQITTMLKRCDIHGCNSNSLPEIVVGIQGNQGMPMENGGKENGSNFILMDKEKGALMNIDVV